MRSAERRAGSNNVFLRFELIDAVRFRAAERLRSGLVWSGHVFDRRVEIKHFLDFDDVFGRYSDTLIFHHLD